MAKKRKIQRHRLLVYYRMGQRLRTIPLMTMILGVVLYGLGWLAEAGIMQGGNIEFVQTLWQNRMLIIGLIVFSLLLYILLIGISRGSYVQARPRALRIRAGLVPIDISYGRIRVLKLVHVGTQYPPDELKGSQYALLEPYLDKTATTVELRSWPNMPLKRLWHEFMFTSDGRNLLLIVENALELNKDIDTAITLRDTRVKKRGYKDPIDRAVDSDRF